MTESLWPGLVLWVVLYVSDYAITLACARMYRAGVREIFVYEGGLELTPYFRKEVDALRVLSPRFLLALLWGVVTLSALWWLTRPPLWSEPYAFGLGAMVLVELTVHVRHARNLFLFQTALAGQGVYGRVEYRRATLLRLSAVEVLAFAILFLVAFATTGSWFVLGGAVGCLSLAWKHWRLARKQLSGVPQGAQLHEADKARAR